MVLLLSHLTWCVIRTLHTSFLDPMEPDVQCRVPGKLRTIFTKILQDFTAHLMSLYVTQVSDVK